MQSHEQNPAVHPQAAVPHHLWAWCFPLICATQIKSAEGAALA